MAKNKIKNNLRRIRSKLGWTQNDLAEKSQVTIRTISKIESDPDYEPAALVKGKLISALDCSEQALFPSLEESENSIQIESPFRFSLVGASGLTLDQCFIKPCLRLGDYEIDYADLVEALVKTKRHFFISGESGSGKTYLLVRLAETLRSEGLIPIWVPLHLIHARSSIIDDLALFLQTSRQADWGTISSGKAKVLWLLDGLEGLSLSSDSGVSEGYLGAFFSFVQSANLFGGCHRVVLSSNSIFSSTFFQYFNFLEHIQILGSWKENQGQVEEWCSILSKEMGWGESNTQILKQKPISSLTYNPLLLSLCLRSLVNNKGDRCNLPLASNIEDIVQQLYMRPWNYGYRQICNSGFSGFVELLSWLAFLSLQNESRAFDMSDLNRMESKAKEELISKTFGNSNVRFRLILSRFPVDTFRSRFKFSNEYLFQWLLAKHCALNGKEVEDLQQENPSLDFQRAEEFYYQMDGDVIDVESKAV